MNYIRNMLVVLLVYIAKSFEEVEIISPINISQCTDQNCIQCSISIDICGMCLQSYYLVSNKCVLCSVAIPNCLNCQQEQTVVTCNTCSQGYILRQNICKSCSNFIPRCIICDIFSNTCTNCTQSYYLDPSNTSCISCQNIAVGCLTCSTPYINGTYYNATCTQCFPNHILVDQHQCVTCSIFIQNCITCNTTQKTCMQCNDKFVLLFGKKCLRCAVLVDFCDSCILIKEELICSSCAIGYGLKDNNCTNCSLPLRDCLKCSYNNETRWTCLKCIDPYSLITQTGCKPCSELISNCTKCAFNASTLDKKCYICGNGLIVVNNICTACSDVIADCNICSQDTQNLMIQCIQCNNGKVLSPDSRSCQEFSMQTIIIVAAIAGVAIIGIIFLAVCIIRKKKLDSLKSSLSQVTSNDSYFKISKDSNTLHE